MNKIKRVLIVLIVIANFVSLDAQQITVPYLMGFEEEDSVELSNWHLNPGTKADLCEDQWIVGDATNNGGRQSLYISNNNGKDCQFGATPNVQYAYRDFILPKGQYIVSFDWRCMGSPYASLTAGIAVTSVLPAMEALPNKSVYPSEINAFLMAECKNMRNATRWRNVVITGSGTQSSFISSNGTRALRLFFIWASNNKDTTLQVPLGACIDNVQITSANCPIPSQIMANVINCDSTFVEWEGTSEEYILEYKRHGNNKWISHTHLLSNNFVLENLSEGMYDIRIQGVCESEKSAYKYLNNFVVFCPENHCLNYVNLEDTNVVTCNYGVFNDPYYATGVVDFGSSERLSRHTVNWDSNLFDSRTGGQLPLIPDGELASVRLGNWDIGAQAEAVSYKYHVDAENSAILLLKYAIVMEDPQHNEKDQPKFVLEILDEHGELVDEICGAAYFAADAEISSPGWHVNKKTNIPVTWKEWTTVGLNLAKYDGQDITIRLTTYDCAQSGHYGYAYFTLGCTNAKIYSNSCGDEADVRINAPDGFTYQWYNNKNEKVPESLGGTSSSLTLQSSDTTTYTCRLTSTENPECFFDLSTANKPRYPIAEFQIKYDPTNCQNKVRFNNRSHIFTRFNDNAIHHYDEECEQYEWIFPDGDKRVEKDPIIIFPAEGGSFEVTLMASIADGACVDDTTITFTLPPIGDKETIIDTAICQGSYLVLGDKHSDSIYYAADAGSYRVSWKSVAGCDSTFVWNLSLNPTDDISLEDTIICAESMLCIDDDCYRPNNKNMFVRIKPNRFGCDSVISMKVTILDSIKAKVDMVDIEGTQANGQIIVDGTGFTYYTVNGQHYPASTHQITDLGGGEYELLFFNDYGCYTDTILTMQYPCKEMIFQRWDDVLSVYKSDMLGGLVLASFQWMKNNIDIPGATLSYYYDSNGLDAGSEYTVRAVTIDGDIIVSCPFYPKQYVPSIVKRQKLIKNQQLFVRIDNVMYNAQGRRIE